MMEIQQLDLAAKDDAAIVLTDEFCINNLKIITVSPVYRDLVNLTET